MSSRKTPYFRTKPTDRNTKILTAVQIKSIQNINTPLIDFRFNLFDSYKLEEVDDVSGSSWS